MAAGEGGGGSKAILKVPVDSAEFDAFLEKVHAYHQTLEELPEAWRDSNKGIKLVKTSFDDVEKSFDTLVQSVASPKVGKSFESISKTSKETEKSWRNVSRELEKSAKSMQGLLSGGNKFASLGQLFGIGGLAAGAGALFGAVKGADNSLADQNILNRKLGLKPGEEPAFTNTFEKAGGDDALLHKVASAQAHQDQWKSFMALGLSTDQITGMDPAHLAAEVLRRGGEQFNQRGASTGLWADQTGVSSLMDVNSMRLAGSYQGQFGDMNKQFEELTPKLAAQQKTLDEATAARQKIEAALAQDALELDKALIKLNPMVISAADGITKWVTAFAESGQLNDAIKSTASAFEEIGKDAHWLADELNDLFGLKDKKDDKGGIDLYHADSGSLPANAKQLAENAWNLMHGKPLDNGPSAPIDWRVGGGSNSNSGTPTRDQLLDATRYVESHDKPNAVGPVTKEGWQAKGAYQFSPADLKRYGVTNPFDERAERAGADRKFDDLKAKYGDNLHEQEAAYNWGEGNVDSHLKKHKGVWDERDLPPDVKDYLQKMDARTGKTSTFDDPKAIAVDKAATAKLTGANSTATADSVAKTNAENPDNRAVDDMLERLRRGFGMMGDTLREGGGAGLRTPDAPRAPTSTQQAPFGINVQITNATGSSVNVTTSSLAQ